jgi:tetratricopeptide (TPR) repeat protein
LNALRISKIFSAAPSSDAREEMVNLTEITDELESKLDLKPSSQQHGNATTTQPARAGPELPPGMAANVGKSAAEILAELNKSPLFMTELEENDDVAALQALAYEGTALENATDFKERGNECFREKRPADAKEFYTKGVLILTAEERRRAKGEKPTKEGESDDPEEVARQREVLETLYVNRAAAHLELKNFRSCTLDCAAALRLNPANSKALYRSARALLAVGRVEEAEDACARGLLVEPNNKALQALRKDIAARAAALSEKQKAEAERAAKARRRKALLRAALAARGIRTRKTAQPPEMEDARVRLEPDEDSAESLLVFPAMLVYPADLQTDFIKALGEAETLGQHLGYVLPLPWDAGGRKYGGANGTGVECFIETAKGGLIKVGKKIPLLRVLGSGSVEVVDDLVRIYVLPKAGAEAWVKEFKAKKAVEMAGK